MYYSKVTKVKAINLICFSKLFLATLNVLWRDAFVTCEGIAITIINFKKCSSEVIYTIMYVQLQCETLQSTLNLWDSVWLPRIHIKVLSLNHINYRHELSCIHYFVWPPLAKGWRFFSIGNREPLSAVAQTSIMLLCNIRGVELKQYSLCCLWKARDETQQYSLC